MLTLRGYQVEAMDAVTAAWRRGMLRPAVVLPTGSGKTVVFAHLISIWLKLNPGRRALVVAHRTELIEQAADKIHDVAPWLSVGIVKANRNETLASVVVGSVQTLRNKSRRLMLRDVGMIVIDECHHATSTSYGLVLDHWPDALTVGFTATMSRSDNANLGDVWHDVVHIETIQDLINHDPPYLVRPRGIRVYVDTLDMSGVRKSGGDYREVDLGRAIEGSLAPEAIASAIRQHAADKPTIVFAPTVKSAVCVADAIAAEGFKTATVWGAQDQAARKQALKDFRAGDVQVLVNCMVLTEGTDLPMASCIVIARPTLHSGLFIQMAGRGLRLFPGKDECLILDVVGASQKHGLTAPVELFGEETPEREKPFCELCGDCRVDTTPGTCLCECHTAALEEREGEDVEVDDYAVGPLAHTEVDLFHGSTSAWMRSFAGVWFLAAGERYIAILPGVDGSYDVCAMHKTQRGSGRWIIRGVKDMSWAMSWSEGEVSSQELSLARKSSSWRSRGPSVKQKALASRLGLVINESMRSGEVARLITECVASSRIDPPLTAFLAGRR